MTPHELLSHLRNLNIHVWREGDKLRCSAPPGVLTEGLKNELNHCKHGLLLLIDELVSVTNHDPIIVPIQPKGRRQAFFACPGHNGDVYCFLQLARHLGADQPFYALQPPGVSGKNTCPDKIEDLASLYVKALLTFQEHGPFLLGGFCLGGTIAFEVARQLRACGRDVAFLVFFGCACPTSFSVRNRILAKLNHGVTRVVYHFRTVRCLSISEQLTYVKDRVRHQDRGRSLPPNGVAPHQTPHQIAVGRTSVLAARHYRKRMQPYDGGITLFSPCRDWISTGDRPMDWQRFAKRGVEIFIGPDHCHIDRMLLEPDVRIFARDLRLRLDQLETSSPINA
jgi:thioesterase domain-containing protein